MRKKTQRSLDRFDWDIRAADALELARQMPPGQERSEALKLASLLRCTADARGLIFAKRGQAAKVKPTACFALTSTGPAASTLTCAMRRQAPLKMQKRRPK
jgi:hypothetical protein